MYDLKQYAKEDLEAYFDGSEYNTPDDGEQNLPGSEESKPLNIFFNGPPRHDDPDDDLDDFPYLVLATSEGGRSAADSPEQITLRIVVGIYDMDPNYAGGNTRDLIIRRILDHFDAHPLLASRYRCVFPRNFANPDDDTWPYFFGTVDLPFERVTMEEEDPYV